MTFSEMKIIYILRRSLARNFVQQITSMPVIMIDKVILKITMMMMNEDHCSNKIIIVIIIIDSKSISGLFIFAWLTTFKGTG